MTWWLVVDLHNVTGLFAAVAIILAATGILLNHLELFGVSRPAPSVAPGRPALADALSVPATVKRAQAADLHTRRGGGEPAELDRATWSPGDGVVDVRARGGPGQVGHFSPAQPDGSSTRPNAMTCASPRGTPAS